VRALFFGDVEVDGELTAARCAGGRIEGLGPDLLPQAGDEVVDGRGGALIPGLHDHHLHLMAAAAALGSVHLGPPDVRSPPAFRRALREADRRLAPGRWLRGVGYHESVAGELDRAALDAIVAERPVRIQHRSGALWMLNSLACREAGVTAARATGEHDSDDLSKGRLFRRDEWLGERTGGAESPDLSELGQMLASYGVTGVTDATPSTKTRWIDTLASSALPQRLTAMGGPALTAASFTPPVLAGPVKIMLDEDRLPSAEGLTAWIGSAHAHDRCVALHIVTRASLVLALVAWETAGARPGDRIEHGSVIPDELIGQIADLGLTVVTQPNFVAERGRDYQREVEARDQGDLYRCASLLGRGVAVAAGTDAPFGRLDPWLAISAAVTRMTGDGPLNAAEAVDPATALGLFLGTADDPGGPPRTVRRGAPADLVLLGGPLDHVLREPTSAWVRRTVVGGVPVASNP
jgi:predicted amidohydrolase YtcJ